MLANVDAPPAAPPPPDEPGGNVTPKAASTSLGLLSIGCLEASPGRREVSGLVGDVTS